MFVGFEINSYKPLTASNPTERSKFKNSAKSRFGKLSEYISGTYKSHALIDAKKVSEELFPVNEYDIFLSHSHGDQDKAIDIAVALKDKGLNVFVDSCVWGHYSELIKRIAEAEAGSIERVSTERLIEISADAHMLLASALHHVIARTEAFLFLNTSISAPLKKGGASITFSPWIFSELEFSFLAEHSAPKRYGSMSMESVTGVQNLALASAKHFTAFRAYNDHLPHILGSTFCNWYECLTKDHSNGHPLDILYETFNIARIYNRKRESLLLG